MRLLFACLLMLQFGGVAGQKNTFSALRYDSVVFYDMIPYSKSGSLWIVDDHGKSLHTIVGTAVLDQATVRTFNRRLGSPSSYVNGTAACFDPHCGLVYYLGQRPVAQIVICLGCNRLASTVDLPANQNGEAGKKSGLQDQGLSKSFRGFINDLLKRYHFGSQAEPGSPFDQ